MRVAVFTMSYNEDVVLPIWVKYYGKVFGRENLYVVDHGSNDGSTDGLHGVNVIRLPRTAFSDIKRSRLISDLCANFLNFFDYVIYTDTDEFLCVDPAAHGDLRSYLERERPEYETAIGLSLTHCFDKEPGINLGRPVLSQRGWAYFLRSMCKTLVTRIPLRWGGGFHYCDQPPRFGAIHNFHLKEMDRAIALDRLRVLRGIQREGNFGIHQMREDESLERHFDHIRAKTREESFDFSENIAEMLPLYKEKPVGRFACDPFDSRVPNTLRPIPPQFRGLF